jgi:hypothetical protein
MKLIRRKTVVEGKVTAPKAVKAKRGTKAAAAPKQEPTHDEIAKRAYELYLARGGDAGEPEQDWLRAESELRSV